MRLIGIGAGAAVATFAYFALYPALDSAVRAFATTGLILLVIGWILLLLVVLLYPVRELIAAVKVHAAIYCSYLVIMALTAEPGHSSPIDGLEHAILAFLFGLLFVELLVLLVSIARSPQTDRAFAGGAWLFPGLTIALLGGWGVGVMVWSETVPARVVAAAEGEAGDQPYCLNVVGRRVQSRRDLTGLSMHSPNAGGYFWRLHALLVMEESAGKSFFNWSYKARRFERLSDKAQTALHLDERSYCQPVPHFARDLRFFKMS
ncbi:MAG TPA: hypothetical protein VIQ05_21340 [Tardiphaga sp.]